MTAKPEGEGPEDVVAKVVANPSVSKILGPTLGAVVAGVWFISNTLGAMRLDEANHHATMQAALVALETKQDMRIAALEGALRAGDRWTREDMRNFVLTAGALNQALKLPEIR